MTVAHRYYQAFADYFLQHEDRRIEGDGENSSPLSFFSLHCAKRIVIPSVTSQTGTKLKVGNSKQV